MPTLPTSPMDPLAPALPGREPPDASDDPREADEAPPEAATPPARPGGVFLALVGVLAIPAVLFFLLPPLSASGLWDPYELNTAELARRYALNALGGAHLTIVGADNSMPHLNDLGRPQLAVTSIGLGFRLLGLHDWAGRFPLALWGALGVLATYAFVARLADRRAGVYSAAVLCTMPLYVVQARSLMGEVPTMAAVAMAFGGLAVAVFGDDRGPRRVGWLLLGALGLVTGYASRGALLGVAAPLLAVGLSVGVVRLASDPAAGRRTDGLGLLVGLGSLLVGLALLIPVGRDLSLEKAPNLSMWVGAMVKAQSKYPTFDALVGHLGHALAPWSAFLPFALGRLLLPPRAFQGTVTRESSLRVALLVGVSVIFAAHSLMAPRTELVVFTAPALLAAACGVALRDLERGAPASAAVGLGTVVFLGVFHHDFHSLPEKAYQAFGIVGATFPESFKDQALHLWTVVLIGFAGLAFVSFVERDASREPFAPRGYWGVFHTLRTVWDGLLALSYLAAVTGAAAVAVGVWLGLRFHWKTVAGFSVQLRDVAINAWWIIAVAPLAVIFGMFFLCDLWLWAFGRARDLKVTSLLRGFEPFEELFRKLREGEGGQRSLGAFLILPFMVLAIPVGVLGLLHKQGVKLPIALALAVPSGILFFLLLGFVGDLVRGRRATGLVLGGGALGALLSVAYYPALANQLSPKEVFGSYEHSRRGDEPLGLFGVGGRTAAYYAGGQPPSFSDAPAAFAWLMGGGGQRRFLAVKADELPRLNQLYREQSRPRENMPVLDARSSQILLVASSPVGEKADNPLDKIVTASPPQPQRRLDVNMDDKLQVLGLDLVDLAGRPVDFVSPGKKYRLRTYYRVLAPVGAEWEAFIHIDGFRRRHNGDHKPAGGKYPMSMWLKDDVVMDDHEFALEPNFSPGAYTLYFGFFLGETRMRVKSGPSDGDNRVNAGPLRVQ